MKGDDLSVPRCLRRQDPREGLSRSRTLAGSVRLTPLFTPRGFHLPLLGHLPRTKPKLLPPPMTRRRLPTCAARHDSRAHPRAPVLARWFSTPSSAAPKNDTGRTARHRESQHDLSVCLIPWHHRPRSLVVFPCSRRLGSPPQRRVDQDSPSSAFAKSYAFRENQELSISPSGERCDPRCRSALAPAVP